MEETIVEQSEEKRLAELDQNMAIALSEATAGFLQPAESSDAELIRAAVEFTTEISPEQNKVIVMYEMLVLDEDVNAKAKAKLRIIINAFHKRQKFYNTKAYIMHIIESMSWRRFASAGLISGSISKTEMK